MRSVKLFGLTFSRKSASPVGYDEVLEDYQMPTTREPCYRRTAPTSGPDNETAQNDATTGPLPHGGPVYRSSLGDASR